MSWRWGVALGLLALVLGAFWFALPESSKPIGEGDQALSFTLPDLQGRPYALPRGDVVLLNFWATWCPPCRQELPSMAELYRRLAGRGLKVVAVSVDENRELLEGFVHENQLPFQVLHDQDAAVSRRYGVFKYPESFLIDRAGKVRYHLIGAVDWMSAPVLRMLNNLLEEGAHGAPSTR